MTVDYALPDGDYGLELRPPAVADASGIGRISVVDGRGTWSGSVPSARSGTVVRMVDATGVAVCQAELRAV